MLHLSIPAKYIGKEIEVLMYAKDELIEDKVKGNAARFKGILSSEEADQFNQQINDARKQWERDI